MKKKLKIEIWAFKSAWKSFLCSNQAPCVVLCFMCDIVMKGDESGGNKVTLSETIRRESDQTENTQYWRKSLLVLNFKEQNYRGCRDGFKIWNLLRVTLTTFIAQDVHQRNLYTCFTVQNIKHL